MLCDNHALAAFPEDQVRSFAWPLCPAFAPQAPDRLYRPHRITLIHNDLIFKAYAAMPCALAPFPISLPLAIVAWQTGRILQVGGVV
jgi:hypothetical protein